MDNSPRLPYAAIVLAVGLTVATLISERVDAETASQQLGHSSPTITREFYISKPAIAADVAHVLEEFGHTRPGDDSNTSGIGEE